MSRIEENMKMQNNDEAWRLESLSYRALICDEERDSLYLREMGLRKNISRLIGQSIEGVVLDVGCGDGWLLRSLKPRHAVACDITKQLKVEDGIEFTTCDASKLLYLDNQFDLVVCSLVLMWIPNYDVVVSELMRVAKPGGIVVIVLMQPYFYRTGEVDEHDNFVITRDLSKPFVIKDHRIAEQVGPFAYHYRPMPDYLNACIKAGLRIEEVADWHLDLDDYIKRFGGPQQGAIRRTGKVPMYLFIKCRKE